MYLYLYDSFLSDGKYEKELSEIENYLTDLGITGTIERVSVFKTIKDILKSALKKGAQTIVVVGNDNTFREAIKFIPDFGITFGFIPLGQPNYIARFLGIPAGVASCDTLSARIIEKIDVGKISAGGGSSTGSGNDKYFLGAITVPKMHAKINCDGKYSITLKEIGDVTICNTPFSEETAEFSARGGLRPLASEKDTFLDPRDGKLDIFIVTSPSSIFKKIRGWLGDKGEIFHQSHLTAREIKIESEDNVTLFVDKMEMTDKNFNIGLAEKKIKLIIGKSRLF
jgi:diacylglycerol kinase family enzyme